MNGPSQAPQTVIAAVTLWRAGDHDEARATLERLGPAAVWPLFGFYLGLLLDCEIRGDFDADQFLRLVALDLALQHGRAAE